MTSNEFPPLVRETRYHRDAELPRVLPDRGLSPSPQPSPNHSRAPSIHLADEQPPRNFQQPIKRRRHVHEAPQKGIDNFWASFTTKNPGKAYTILPNNFYAKRAAAHTYLSTTSSSLQTPSGIFPPHNALDSSHTRRDAQNAVASYEEARQACLHKVEKIVQECHRLNQKYRDPHFDIEADFKRWLRWGNPPDCLMGLADQTTELKPMSVKRVEDIFEDPKFYIEGASANDVRQGKEGDCWLMAALCTLSNKPGLIDRVCVAMNEKVGVYGFVFHRDGEWISEVIDDKLYLIKEDFDEALLERNKWLELQNRTSPEEEYRTVMQTGSRALYFAQCSDANETWLPLLEKAYAKAHGDYSALESGFVGEGIEDLTGGVTTELFSTDILDKDKFWREELLNVNKQFLFGCGQMGGKYGQRKGILEKHAYSIMEAREINGEKLLKLRNPWGNSEWTGAWSDGSAEWTPQWMEQLNHKFGDDGVFWISYRDMLRNYQHFDRTRLFGPEWTVTQQWTSLNVPWSVDYLDTKFKISLAKASHVVIVLSQLDDRYFRGLEGQYEFHLQFRVHGAGEEDYIVRSNSTYYMRRSVSTELNLEAGDYYILLKVTAKRYPNDPTPEEIVRKSCHNRREKLLSIGLSYDLAHAKGQFRLLERLEKETKKHNRREKRKETAKKMHEARRMTHKKQKLKGIKTDIRRQERAMQREQREQEKRKAAMEAEQQAQIAAAQTSAAQTTEPECLEEGLQNFTLGEKQQPKKAEGLGIAIEDQDTSTPPPTSSGSVPAPINTTSNPTSQPHRATFPPLTNGDAYASLPATPPLTGGFHQQRSSISSSRQARRDTLGQPGRRGTLSPLPQVRISRPSIVKANSKGKSLTLSDISDDDMSWDSALDGPEDSESDFSDLDGDSGFGGGPGGEGGFGAFLSGDGPRGGGKGGSSSHQHDDSEDDFDPWNAVCVVGLRVFCEDKEREAKVKVEVVRPDGLHDSADGGSGPGRDATASGRKGMGQRRLDVDDAAESAARGVRKEMFGTYGSLLEEGRLGGGLPAHLEPR